jgi:hypothetical protein
MFNNCILSSVQVNKRLPMSECSQAEHGTYYSSINNLMLPAAITCNCWLMKYSTRQQHIAG